MGWGEDADAPYDLGGPLEIAMQLPIRGKGWSERFLSVSNHLRFTKSHPHPF